MKYLTSAFSPMMVETTEKGRCFAFQGEGILLEHAKKLAEDSTSAVGHEITAKILSALLSMPVAFSRINLVLRKGDEVICIIPNFRSTEAREFTLQEVEKAGFRAFRIWV